MRISTCQTGREATRADKLGHHNPTSRLRRGLAETQRAFGAGSPVIIYESVDGEVVADLCVPAEALDVALTAFLVEFTSGMIAATIDLGTSERLDLPMLRANLSRDSGRFCVAVDAISDSTGISARDRAHTIGRISDPRSLASDFTRPGHVVPVITGGMFASNRWTRYDAADALSRSVGLGGVVAIATLVDGLTGATEFDAEGFARSYAIPMVTASALRGL